MLSNEYLFLAVWQHALQIRLRQQHTFYGPSNPIPSRRFNIVWHPRTIHLDLTVQTELAA